MKSGSNKRMNFANLQHHLLFLAGAKIHSNMITILMFFEEFSKNFTEYSQQPDSVKFPDDFFYWHLILPKQTFTLQQNTTP